MSYILDALKKSEKQRPPGPVPDLFTVHGPLPTGPRHLPWLPLLAATLLVCAVGLGVWIGSRAGKRTIVPGPVAPISPQRVETPAVESPSPPEHPATAAAVPEAAPRKEPVIRSTVSKTRPAAPKVPTTPSKAAPKASDPRASPMPYPPVGTASATVPTPPAVIPPTPSPVKPDPPGEPRGDPQPEPPSGTPAAISQPAGTALPPDPVAAVETPPPDGRIVELGDLPPGVRGEIPSVTISGHVWSEDPSLRVVTIQDRIFREGAEVGPGLRLEEITSAGAVLGFRGYRFRVRGF